MRYAAVTRVFVLSLLAASCGAVYAQVAEKTYQELHWRMVGPFRGGRTRAAKGAGPEIADAHDCLAERQDDRRKNHRVLFPERQIRFVALGVVNGGGTVQIGRAHV